MGLILILLGVALIAVAAKLDSPQRNRRLQRRAAQQLRAQEHANELEAFAARADAEDARWRAGDPLAVFGRWLPHPAFMPEIVADPQENRDETAESGRDSAESAGMADFTESVDADRRIVAAFAALPGATFTKKQVIQAEIDEAMWQAWDIDRCDCCA